MARRTSPARRPAAAAGVRPSTFPMATTARMHSPPGGNKDDDEDDEDDEDDDDEEEADNAVVEVVEVGRGPTTVEGDGGGGNGSELFTRTMPMVSAE